jgi:hypothetical protein
VLPAVSPTSPLPVSAGAVGDVVGLPLPPSVGVVVVVGVVVGVGEMVGVGDMGPTVGVAEVAGEPLDVAGVGVTDGVDVTHVGVGVGDGDGVRLRSSSSAFSALPPAVATAGADEAAPVLVTSVVTAAVQVEDVVGRGDAVPLDEVAPAPRVGP